LKFRLATSADQMDWESFVSGFSSAEFSHSYGMKAVYEDVYGYRTAYWIGEEGGNICGVCPLVHVNSLMHMGKTFLISLPMVTSAGLLTADPETQAGFVGHLASVGASSQAIIQLRGRSENALKDFDSYRGYVTFDLPLKGRTADDYWSGLSSRNRGKIRKSRAAGTTIEFGGQDCLDDFYKLHLRRNKELATPAYPKAFFTAILNVFPDAHIALARNEGAPVAAMLNVGFNGVMNYLFGSSDSRFFDSYPNNQLFHEFIEFSRRNGYTRIDLGRTPLGAGTYDFKKQWGANEVPLYYQYLGKGAEKFIDFSIQRVQQSFTFKVFSQVWSRLLPERLTEKLGPSLIKRMPLA
jgi:FemAB-related protein (PEP-CTERM system-associated)